MAKKRPLTVREMQKKKQKQQAVVRLYNCSRQQVPIHLNAPKGVDFFFGAQDVRLNPGQHHTFDKSRITPEQVERLSKQGMIRVLYDSENHPVA